MYSVFMLYSVHMQCHYAMVLTLYAMVLTCNGIDTHAVITYHTRYAVLGSVIATVPMECYHAVVLICSGSHLVMLLHGYSQLPTELN